MERMGRKGLNVRAVVVWVVVLALMLAGCAAGDTNFTNVVASGSVSSGTTMTAGTGLTVTSGGATITAGTLNANAGIAVDTSAFTVADTTGNTVVAGTLQVTGDASMGTVTRKDKIILSTGSYTMTAAQSGGLFDNYGASGGITVLLPATAAGLNYCFATATAQQIAVDPAADSIILGLANANGDKITNNTLGNSVCLTAISATQWVATAVYGTWADGN